MSMGNSPPISRTHTGSSQAGRPRFTTMASSAGTRVTGNPTGDAPGNGVSAPIAGRGGVRPRTRRAVAYS